MPVAVAPVPPPHIDAAPLCRQAPPLFINRIPYHIHVIRKSLSLPRRNEKEQHPPLIQLADTVRALLTTKPWGLFFEIIEPMYLELTLKLCSTFHLQVVMTEFDVPGMVQFLEWSSSVSKQFQGIGSRPITAIITCHPGSHPDGTARDIAPGHVFDLAYFISFAIRHQTERHKKGVISIGPYVTRQARYFGPLNTVAQASSLTLIGQMSPQAKQEDLEDITDDVPPPHEDPAFQPSPIHRPVHATASLSDISERLTLFEQQYFQCFDHINSTLHQICQYLHISSPPPPRKPSGDEDV
ncbi:hypothetical protein GOBAR_AA03851 [Gossypium barbadense]|uniref:Uncharacterized protein n=1 Tax=Gossypium barbadense TaxID=3634 RepID=A0A2P5YMB6_GOSBA|nr:hypothetical protein GOBAR_AA03851 [Gossypium barbadense]